MTEGQATDHDLQTQVVRLSAELDAFKTRQAEGFAVDFADFPYKPRHRNWSESAGALQLRRLFKAQEAQYAALMERFCGFDVQFRAIPIAPEEGRPGWDNAWLPGLDAVALYGLLATRNPRLFLEIGSGHSTKFARQAICDHGLQTKIVSIDPHPTAEIDALCDEVIRTNCEDVPVTVFQDLGRGDMLHMDGTHRSFQNSDATVFFTEILPSLKSGVIYGLHDVFLPVDYPDSWTTRFYNEQYLLMSYLLGGAAGDAVILPTHHVSRDPAFAHLRNRLYLGAKNLDWLASSFWMERASGF